MWNRFSFIWTERLRLDSSQTPTLCCSHIRPPYKLEAGGGGVECILPCVMWLFAEKWIDLAPWCHTHSLWPGWRCVRQTCWVQEVWDPFTTSSRQRTEGPVSWSQDGTIMSHPATTTTSFQVLVKPSPCSFLLHRPSSSGIWYSSIQKSKTSLRSRFNTIQDLMHKKLQANVLR